MNRRNHTLTRLAVLVLVGNMVASLVAEAVEVPFAEHTVAGTFDSARSVFAADVDGDGDTDILGAAGIADDITWWENTAGDGSAWAEHTVANAFDGAYSVYASDVDGDGDTDILGAANSADDIAWWENTAGNGTAWTERIVDGDFDGATWVHAADVDGDGDMDILGTAFFANEVAWWENTAGDGSAWIEHTLEVNFSIALSVYASDVDGDGDTDILGAAEGADAITWWENTAGNGSAWSEHTVDGTFDGAVSVYTADVDGDGDTDILGAALNADDVTWWENTAGDGSAWSEHTVDGTFDGARRVLASDVDGDGDTDILGAALNADAITWWENTVGDGSTWTEHQVNGTFDGANSVYVADVDGDGDADILGAARLADDITWWENETIHSSAVHPVEHTVDGAFDGANAVFAADVDGDGDTDILGAAFFADDVTWWENSAGDGSTWIEHTVAGAINGAQSVYASDVDGDGDTDILGAAAFADDITWWENSAGDGSTWTERIVEGEFDRASSVFAADVDGDGDTDILGAAAFAKDITWWENSAGDGSTWTEHIADGDFNGAVSVYATDVDGDGDTDILGAAVTDDDITWWENTVGDGSTWTEHAVDSDFNGARSVFAADVDGDGDTDILGAALHADDIAWWENTAGDGSTWTEHIVDGDFNGAWSVYATDVDSDGDLDILGAASVANDITWWENTLGDGSTWTEHTVDGDFTGAISVYATDVDGDGGTDILGAADSADAITWWENQGGQFALPTSDVAPVRVINGTSVVALEIDAIHRGRAGDQDVELVTVELLLEDGTGMPLTDAQADALLVDLTFYLDDGSGALEPGTDTVVETITSFALTAGMLTVSFADADPNVQIAVAGSKKYFVGLTFEASASVATPDEIRVTHVTEASSTGEDAEHDLPIVLEYSSNTASTVVEVNDAPVALPDMIIMLEDGTGVGNVLDGTSGGLDFDEENDPLTALLFSGPSSGVLVGGLAADGGFTYQPNADFNGVDTFAYVVSDGLEDINSASVTITVGAVNDAPNFIITPLLTVDQDLGPQTVPGFATNISAGAIDESGQNLTFSITGNTNAALFSTAPALATDGTLTFTSEPLAIGTATITVELMDDGGTDNGGIDTSLPQEFEIEITDGVAPDVVALVAVSGGGPGVVLEDCAESKEAIAEVIVGFSELMADPPGDSDAEDVTNPANYQLVASGPDNDLTTMGCNAVLGDDVLVSPDVVTFDTLTNEAALAFTPSRGDGIYRLFVCGGIEDASGNPLAQDVDVTFRQSASSVFDNGHFDCDLRDWVPVSTLPEAIEFSAEDINDASVSGSVHVTNLSGTQFSLGQCVDTNQPTYRIGANIRIDAAAGVMVRVTTTCEFFDAAGCTGTSLEQSSSVEQLPETAGLWLPVTSVVGAEGAASALCSFDLTLVLGTIFDAYLDDLVLVGPLFFDGFESGDTSAWSATVP